MDNRDNRPLREAMEERYIEWIVGLEKATSIFRIVQTMLVLMEWLLPLLEDIGCEPTRHHDNVPRSSLGIGDRDAKADSSAA